MNRFLLPMLLGLVGCGDQAFFTAEDAGGDFGGADLEAEADQIRIDILPSSTTPEISPQSWIAPVDADLSALNVRVFPSVNIEGTVLGYEATPYGAEVPGLDDEPIPAQVTLLRPGTINSASVATNADGTFLLSIPPARGYQLSIVPHDAPSVPFLIEMGLSLTEAQDFEEIDLGYGEPIYGKVLYSDGNPVEGVQVRAVDAATGIEGPETTTDSLGHYMIRAEPGELDVIAGGNPGTYIPTLTQSVEVTDEGIGPLDFDMGDISPVQISGQVLGADSGIHQKDITVRFKSRGLTEVDGDLLVETETDGDGLFSRSILPGDWVLSLIPPVDSDYSPTTLEFTVETNQSNPLNLEEITLPNRIQISRKVVDPNGNPLPGAVVNAYEIGFDGYIYSATADAKGRVELELPAVPMELVLVPPTPQLAVTRMDFNPATDGSSFEVKEGQRVAGNVRNAGVPVSFALVEVRDANGTLLASTITDPDGQFAVRVEIND